MTFPSQTSGVNKSGGDVSQANLGQQTNRSDQDLAGAAVGGFGFGGTGGAGTVQQAASQTVDQALGQSNVGYGGEGGDDNIQANTNINI